MYNRYFLKLIVTLLQLLRLKSIQQQQQSSLGPKILGSALDTKHTSESQPHVVFSTILFYLKSYFLLPA